MRRLPPLNALRAFDAAARHLNISAAARELHVTHSAVSHQVRQLEEWLGKSLFVRHAGGVRLTIEGQRLMQAADQIFSQLQTCCEELVEQAQIAEIVLGAPASFLSNWLIPRLERFEAAHPNVRVRLQTSGTIEDLQKQIIDCLVVSGESWPADVDAVSLFDETIGPVCAPDWAPRFRGPDDLVGQPLLHTSSRPHAWEAWAASNRLDPSLFANGRRFDHLSLLLEAAAARLGVAIAPALLVEREISQERLIAPLGFIKTDATFAFCSKRDQQGGAVRILREWLCLEASTEIRA
ncbi:LysR substrate-binding domain-containing protein [Caballeronia cordobensis]|uniref:LysR substrate-binding domain-containing protein n=1 Tax=Caballeronia cordobensis TaxID=1353886 RepID=UPI0005F08291